MPNYGYGYNYDPYNPATSYGYPSPYSTPYTNRYASVPTTSQPTPNVAQNAPQTQSNVPWIQVPNIEAARNVMVQPNQVAYMMNQNAPEFYVKATDGMGVATLRCFKFSEFNPTEEAAKEVLSSQASNLVSRDEFNTFANNVAAQFSAIQQSITPAPVAPVQQVQPVQQMAQPAPVEPAPVVAPPAPPKTTKKKEAQNDGL